MGQIQKWSTSRLHVNNFARDGDTVQDDLPNQLRAYLLARERDGALVTSIHKGESNPTLYGEPAMLRCLARHLNHFLCSTLAGDK